MQKAMLKNKKTLIITAVFIVVFAVCFFSGLGVACSITVALFIPVMYLCMWAMEKFFTSGPEITWGPTDWMWLGRYYHGDINYYHDEIEAAKKKKK